MTWRKVRRSILTSLALVCIGLIGCGGASPETGNAGIPGHRGPASPRSKKLPPPRSSPKTRRGAGELPSSSDIPRTRAG
jgi:hypothetical protein